MEQRKRKAINFDLDTNAMKERGLYPDGYRELGKFFHKQGFMHRQGSGYVSKDKLNSDEINDIVLNTVIAVPWLAECVKKIDVTDIGRQHDLTEIIRRFGAISGKGRGSESELGSPQPPQDIDNNNDNTNLGPQDKAVITRIKASKLGADFKKLYDGHFAGTPEDADKRLISILLFFTDGNAKQTGRIFKMSKLYVPSKGADYLSGIISSATVQGGAFPKVISKSVGSVQGNSNCR